MPTISAFIAGSTKYEVPTNYTMLILDLMTWDRQNLTGTFTITGTGYSESIQADASGRAVKVVPAGATYTVTLTHNGDYLNDGPQSVVAVSEEIVWVAFNLSEPAIQAYNNIAVSTWASDNTYTDYPYRAAIPISGVTADDIPEVVFDVAEATSGDYAPVSTSYNGGIYIYSARNDSITIPTVVVKHQA